MVFNRLCLSFQYQNNSFTSGLSLHTSPSKDVRKAVTFENVRKSVSELKTQLEEACVKHKDMISQTGEILHKNN